MVFEPTVFDSKSTELDLDSVVECLSERGFVVLRNLFTQSIVDDIKSRCEKLLQKPAVAGSRGYYVVDYPRKILYPSTVIGGHLLDVLLDERVNDVIEKYMKSQCVLAETGVNFDKGVGYEYFPIHCDFWENWSLDGNFHLSKEHLTEPVAVGSVLYLHDTNEGAFCYLDASHRSNLRKADRLSEYPYSMQAELLTKKVRVTGSCGDLILFDSRGFHGPDQPSRCNRLAIISRYYRVGTFGYTQATPILVWTSDLGRFSQRQLRVLGVGSRYMLTPDDYFGNRIRGTKVYKIVTALLANAFIFKHWENKLHMQSRRWWTNLKRFMKRL